MDKNAVLVDENGEARTVEELAKEYADHIRAAFEQDKAEGRWPADMTLQEALNAIADDAGIPDEEELK